MGLKTGLSIHMVVPGMAFTHETATTQALGGSETAAYYLAKELGARGHNVSVYTTADVHTVAGNVAYYPLRSTWASIAHGTAFDVCIAQRAAQVFSTRVSARANILWSHDEALKTHRAEVGSVLFNIDKIAVISAAMRENYKRMHDLEDSILWQTRNGIDLSVFNGVAKPFDDRMPFHIAYAARPERGLDYLLFEILPRLVKLEPRIKLIVAGYQDMDDNPWATLYSACREQMKRFGGHVVNAGQMPKRKLAEMYGSVGAYAYPTPSPSYPGFWETSCISAMEAQAAGLPLVTTARGALTETIHPDAGVLLDLKPGEAGHAEMYCDALLSVLRDKTRWQKMSAAGRAHAQTLDWGPVAEQWEVMLEETIRKKSENKFRLAKHFYRHSDIIAAKKLVDQDPSGELTELGALIDSRYPQIASPDAYQTLYSRVYGTLEYNLDQVQGTQGNGTLRFGQLKSFVQGVLDDAPDDVIPIKTVLDVGCHTGVHTLRLAMAFPAMQITGVDTSPGAIEMLNQMAEKMGIKNVKGIVITELPDDFKVDLVIASEVLEHTVDPIAFIKKIEGRCSDNGYIYINVPFGPWEYPSYVENTPEHLYEFDHHDLADLFKSKRILATSQIVASPKSLENLNEPVGWNIVAYKYEKDKEVGSIDFERKLSRQAPRETVSLVMLCGPTAHPTLDWCLASAVDIADEIVIADTGMTEAGLAIARKYGAKLIPSPSPLQVGFETPRNLALSHAKMDWVLWIDSDERVIDPQNLHRYLRPNMFSGYSIRQHHFATDTTFPADLPVRLFRNNGKIRWYGMIHEHPETGLNKGPGRVSLINDVHIAHIGYLTESIRRQRFDRNLPLLRADVEKYPDRLLQKLFLMRDNVLLASRSVEQNNGRMTKEAHSHCMESIAIWRQYFRGRATYSSADPIEYYSQACTMLGIGFDAEIRLRVNGNGHAGTNFAARWANQDDYMTEMTHRLGTSLDEVA